MEKFALPPGTNWPNRREINSESLTGYLGNNPYFDTPLLDFAPKLDLWWCSKYIDQVYKTNRVEDYILPESVRTSVDWFRNIEAEREGRNYLPISRLCFGIIREIAKDNAGEDAFKREPAERYKLVYWDFEKRDVKGTRVKYGKHSSVLIGEFYEKISQSGNTPLLDIHSHPSVGLFSSPDYVELVSWDPAKGDRRLKGAIVACPDEQILALSTPQTPLATHEVALYGMHLVSKNINEAVEKETVTFNKWYERFHKKIEILYKMSLDFVRSMEGLSTEEMSARYDAHYRSWRPFLIDSADIFLDITNVVRQKTFNRRAQVGNSKHQELYRDLSLKLYRSTDMRHFKEFSA